MATAISSKQFTGARNKFAAIVDALARPFAHNQIMPAPAVRTQQAAILSVETHAAHNGITTLCLAGELSHKSTAIFTDAARAAYATGATALVIDLAGVSKLSMAGLLALHNAARLVAGAPLLNPDDGWSALHAMHASQVAINSGYLRLVNVQPSVARFLAANGVKVEG